MSGKTDYYQVTIPDDKPLEEYHWTQRRAYILERIIEAGTPKVINQTRLAEKFDTTQTNIHKDIQRLKEYIKDNVGRDAVFQSEMLYRKGIKEYVESGNYKKAVDILESWNNWLFDIGAKEKAPEKRQVDQKSKVEIVYNDPFTEEGDEEDRQ